MADYMLLPQRQITIGKKTIAVFEISDENIDSETVRSFGSEWLKFNHFSAEDIKEVGDQYFDIVPSDVYTDKYVLDVGCGTGRWSKYLSKKVMALEAMDPSEAVYSAAALLQEEEHIRVCRASADNIPFADGTFDLVFSLGVLHHVPDTQAAMRKCVEKVKCGGYFLAYLYYNFENRGMLYKLIYQASDYIRRRICKLPTGMKTLVCDLLAFAVYLPFVAIAKLMIALGLRKVAGRIPLSYYADKSLNIIRNDSLDRFGTPLEQRFSQDQIRQMMITCGLHNIVFSEQEPYWHALGQKK